LEATAFSRFRALAEAGNVVPVWRDVPADCLTPVMSWLLSARRQEQSFLLESAEGGERFGRYSFVGSAPYRVLSARGGTVTVKEKGETASERGAWLETMRGFFATMKPVQVPELPRFTGGAVGFVSWDAARGLETIRSRRPARGRARDAADLPDAWFGFYDTILAFDHLRQCILLIAAVRTDADRRPLRAQHAAAVARLDRLAASLARPLPAALMSGRGRRAAKGGNRPRANLTRADYLRMVGAAKEGIREGEIYQVVLSQRFKLSIGCEPFQVYRALRRVNPSPYMYFLRDGEMALAGASPEMLVRVEGRRVQTHPIAGTRPRGEDAAADAVQEEQLRADPKERAEHVMLVDLGRNDLGRVCAPGSVEVAELMTVQKFSHVMHLVSRITGSLADGRDAFDALAAAFPAGTVSGAPKVRAMEIIDALEPEPRGAYAGVVCYVDHSGDLDSCITIRTMLSRGRTAWVQAGGGIVADSDPEREYEETLSKARGVLAAIQEAHRGGAS
jgi:anthranilate synthase component 1